MEKINLKGKTISELETLMTERGHSAFRAKQLFLWINQKRVSEFEQMTNLSKAFRQQLAEEFCLTSVSAQLKESSVEDGTQKYLVTLPDGNTVESVYIPMENRTTLCVSTQVGCKMACSFCATGYQQFTRDLQSWEIVDQLLSIEYPKPITNIVVMGMGEPFDNYEQLKKALEIFQHPMGPQIGKRHITVSTVGLTDKIVDFLGDNLGKLAISLHGTTDEQRSSIMPVNRRFPMKEMLERCRHLTLKGRTRITFEYLMIRDLNDSDEDAHRLAKILRGIPSKINLLAYNENPFIDFKRPSENRVHRFQNILINSGYTATYRKSRGRDIAGACGQLRTQEGRALSVAKRNREARAAAFTH